MVSAVKSIICVDKDEVRVDQMKIHTTRVTATSYKIASNKVLASVE